MQIDTDGTMLKRHQIMHNDLISSMLLILILLWLYIPFFSRCKEKRGVGGVQGNNMNNFSRLSV